MNNCEQRKTTRKGFLYPYCNMVDCAANHAFSCIALQNNDFGSKSCPFFKTMEQNKQEKQVTLDYLASHNRTDLIDKYYGSKEGKAHGC